jgi:prepilin-type N-terminal cleavage/methylation domain-containing protein/prepilin-type processing-associated H-X9-DG protein
MNCRARGRAFTLLEILVVLVISAGLIALAIPVFQRVLESGRATGCVSNLRNIGAALNVYLGEHNMVMPTLKTGRATRDEDLPTIDNTFDKYLKDKSVFACPSDRKWAAVSGTSYSWNNALNGQRATNLNFLGVVKDHGRIPVLGDKEGFHPYTDSKVNILYADGHATKELNFFTAH